MRLEFKSTECGGVYQVNLVDCRWSTQDLLQRLTCDPGWIQQPPGSADTAQWAVSTLYDWQTSDTVLQDFCRQFASTAIKDQLLTLAMQDLIFRDTWSNPHLDCFHNISSIYSYYVKTPARFENHPWHTDSKNLVIQCMLYIVENQSEQQGTWFTRDLAVMNNERRGQITKIPAGPHCGWLLINSDRSLHRGLNYTEQPRYGIKFGIQLKIHRSVAMHSIS